MWEHGSHLIVGENMDAPQVLMRDMTREFANRNVNLTRLVVVGLQSQIVVAQFNAYTVDQGFRNKMDL